MEEKEIRHHDFIVLTDRRSLYTQLKGLVAKAKEVAYDSLKARRGRLQKLLEAEDKIYEEEFVFKVKSRIDEDINERKQTLVKTKEANDKRSEEFLESKRIQQYMNSCYDIRDVIRRKEQKHARECLLEQIAEKERALKREKDLDMFWVNVMKANNKIEDMREDQECCLRKEIVLENKRMLDAQMEEREEKLELERKEKQAEIESVAKVMEEMRLEDFDRQMTKVSPKVFEYRNELLADVERRRCARLAEREAEADEHRQLIADVQREEAEDALKRLANKRAAHEATLEYIAYVKRMRHFIQQQQDVRDNRIDELGRVDTCTKQNIQHKMKLKAEAAAASHAILRRQICEQLERRMREEVERREDKMIINPFGRPDPSPEHLWQKKLQYRRELEHQIAELQRIRRQEEEKFEAELKEARDDQEFCDALLKRVINEGLDYLPAHHNWKILLCPSERFEYVLKAPRSYPTCDAAGDQAPKQCSCEQRNQTLRLKAYGFSKSRNGGGDASINCT